MKKNIALALTALLALGLTNAVAQKTSVQSIEEYRAMLQDGNPADLFEAKGEGLWKQKRGPKNSSLEQCDLGKGLIFLFYNCGHILFYQMEILRRKEYLSGLKRCIYCFIERIQI